MWRKKRAPIQYILMMNGGSKNGGPEEVPEGSIHVKPPMAITVHVEYVGTTDECTEYAPAWNYQEDPVGISFDYMDMDAKLRVRIPWHNIKECSTRPYNKMDFE